MELGKDKRTPEEIEREIKQTQDLFSGYVGHRVGHHEKMVEMEHGVILRKRIRGVFAKIEDNSNDKKSTD
jgi:hypothetical protein